ncbi:hypothetical protein F4X90_20590 [Candidatus Poribacteria bacterium]|nr:hypothetical protein [Candidatus Poribacteria bacterium]
MKPKLTARQREILQFIEANIDEGDLPSFRCISEHFGFTQKAARDHTDTLVKKGYLARSTYKKHSLSLPLDTPQIQRGHLLEKLSFTPNISEARRDVFEIPVYNRISENDPYLLDKEVESTVPVLLKDVEYIKDKCFAFKYVFGEMTAVGIMENDIVICRDIDMPADNDTVLANVRGKNTLRRVFMNGDRLMLFSDILNKEPFWCMFSEVTFIGKCIGVHRMNV